MNRRMRAKVERFAQRVRSDPGYKRDPDLTGRNLMIELANRGMPWYGPMEARRAERIALPGR